MDTATATTTTTKKYGYSTCGELYYGSFDNEQEAAAACIRDRALEPGHKFYTGEATSHTAHDFVNAWDIMQVCMETAGDTAGEAAEDWLSSLQSDKEVVAELEKLVGDFLQARDPVRFFSVDNTRTWCVAYDGTAVAEREG